MKEFEKWRNEYYVSGRSHRADARVWRAALEEVLKQISHAPDGSIVNWIEKEIKGD